MAQVQTPREFKFVGGPSRKRRRNGTLAASSAAKQANKRTCQKRMLSAPAPAPAPPSMPAEPMPPPPLALQSPQPSRRSSSASSQPSPADPAAGLLGGSDLHPLAASHGGPATPPGLDGLLDWPSGGDDNDADTDAALFANAFFPGPGLDASSLFAETLGLPADPPPPLPPPPFPSPAELPTPRDDADGPPATAAPAPNRPAGTALRLYAQPSALDDTTTRIFFQYDQEFCILPLTYDFSANPFRYPLAAMQRSPLLRHCILAVAYKHVDYDTGGCTSEAGAYKRRATQMLLERMPADGGGARDPMLLDAMTVLMTLDCATSALGPWRAHLQRAKRLLQNPAAVPLSPQRRAQIGMLAWIDVTRALTSRNGCILPESTLLRVFDTATAAAGADGVDGDTLEFYGLSGCPRALFACMIRLAAYARELRLVSAMACGRFDLAPVQALARRIACWQSPAFGDPVARPEGLLDLVGGGAAVTGDGPSSSSSSHTDRGHDHNHDPPPHPPPCGVAGQDADPGALDYRLDLYHCAEAWRYALLVYIERVFHCRVAADGLSSSSSSPLSPPSSSPSSSSGSSSSSSSPSSSSSSSRSRILRLLARRTLNHVAACRRSTYVQKQLLLPVFLAGAEVRDASLRTDASEFCVWWATKTRYNMFITVRALLEEVWRRQDGEDGDGGGGGSGVWWGDVFDQQSRDDEKEYMLG